jgi:hypothetical protein
MVHTLSSVEIPPVTLSASVGVNSFAPWRPSTLLSLFMLFPFLSAVLNYPTVSQSLVPRVGFQEQIVKVLMLPLTCSTSAGVSSRAFWRLRTLLFSFIAFPFFGAICD